MAMIAWLGLAVLAGAGLSIALARRNPRRAREHAAEKITSMP